MTVAWEEGREGGREGGREAGRERGREGGRGKWGKREQRIEKVRKLWVKGKNSRLPMRGRFQKYMSHTTKSPATYIDATSSKKLSLCIHPML